MRDVCYSGDQLDRTWWGGLWTGLVIGAVLAAVVCWAGPALAQDANSAQGQIERTIGALVVGNANCSANTMSLTSQLADVHKQLDDARKELAALKAKK